MAAGEVHGDLNWPSPNEDMMPDQVATVIILERFGGAASMIGVMLILVTYLAFKRLRTVPNLFIAMASIANVGASVACLMGRDGVTKGETSALCQAQAFMLEMLMQSDPWWSLAMAVNVFLVFFYGASTTMFRQYLWVYAVICYGAPLIPALALLFVRDSDRGAVYGDATLWCWIEPKWNALRIYTYYLPIWVCIFFSAVIYVAVGCHVFHQRNQLRNLTFSNQGRDPKECWGSEPRDSAEKNLTSRQDYYGTAVTEVQIVSSSDSNPPWTPPQSPGPAAAAAPGSARSSTVNHPTGFSVAVPKPAMLLSRPKTPNPLLPSLFGGGPAAATAATAATAAGGSANPASLPSPQSPPSPSASTATAGTINKADDEPIRPVRSRPLPHPRSHSHSHSHGHHHHHHHQACFETTCTSTHPPRQRSMFSRLPLWRRVSSFCSTFRHKYRRVDAVKKAYLRTSAIFAFSVLFTWTPSSINRVYSLVYPADVHYGLNVASAFVLPLQGVWNAVIYFSTSWRPLCDEVGTLWERRRGKGAAVRLTSGGGGGGGGGRGQQQQNGGGGSSSSGAGGGRLAGHKVRASEESSELELARPLGSRRGEIRAIRGSF